MTCRVGCAPPVAAGGAANAQIQRGRAVALPVPLAAPSHTAAIITAAIISSSPRPSSVAICADSKRSTGNPASSHSNLTHGALHPSPVHGADRALAGALGQAGEWAAAAHDQVLPVAGGTVRSGVPHALRLQAAACWACERPRDCSRSAGVGAGGIAADAWHMLCGPTPDEALLRMPCGVHGRCG